MPLALMAGIMAAVGSVLVHYETIRLLHCNLPSLVLPPRQRILLVVIGALVGHLVEIVLFAIPLWSIPALLQAAHAAGALGGDMQQAIFVSIESYTTLGSPPFDLDGPLRLFAGIEALTGLVLVGWTTAYTYLAMSDLWGRG